MSKRVITDREVQRARDRAHEAGDKALSEMLEQLLDFRRHGRVAVSEHDFTVFYNRGVSWMTMVVDQSGCQWWACTRPSQTARIRGDGGSRGESCRLCREHADEGEAKGVWYEGHPTNVRLKKDDADDRAREARRIAEDAAG